MERLGNEASGTTDSPSPEGTKRAVGDDDRLAEFDRWAGSMKGTAELVKGSWTDPLDREDAEPGVGHR